MRLLVTVTFSLLAACTFEGAPANSIDAAGLTDSGSADSRSVDGCASAAGPNLISHWRLDQLPSPDEQGVADLESMGFLGQTNGRPDCGMAILMPVSAPPPRGVIADHQAWDGVLALDVLVNASTFSPIPSAVLNRDSNGRNDGEFGLYLVDSQAPVLPLVVLRMQDASSEFFICAPRPIDEQWFHVGINFGEPGVELWVDGVQGLDQSSTFNLLGATSACTAGAMPLTLADGVSPIVLGVGTAGAGGGPPFNDAFGSGSIDNLRLFSERRDFTNDAP